MEDPQPPSSSVISLAPGTLRTPEPPALSQDHTSELGPLSKHVNLHFTVSAAPLSRFLPTHSDPQGLTLRSWVSESKCSFTPSSFSAGPLNFLPPFSFSLE